MIQQSCVTEDQTDFKKQAIRMGQREWEMRNLSNNKFNRNRKTGISYSLINSLPCVRIDEA